MKQSKDFVFVNSTETVKQQIKQAEARYNYEKQFENSGKMVKRLRMRKVVRFSDFLQNYFQFDVVDTSTVFKSIELLCGSSQTVEKQEVADQNNNTQEDLPQPTTNQQQADLEWNGLLPLVNVEEVLQEWYQLQSLSTPNESIKNQAVLFCTLSQIPQ